MHAWLLHVWCGGPRPNAADSLALPGFPEGATCCRDNYVDTNVSTVIQAHVAHAHRRLAQMARWIGRTEACAAEFDAKADAIIAGLKKRLLTHECAPAAPMRMAVAWTADLPSDA